jgi:ribosomal protein L37AE/L43A
MDEAAVMERIADSLRDKNPSPPPCSVCGGSRQRRRLNRHGSEYWLCLDCDAARKKTSYHGERNAIRSRDVCRKCGGRQWTGKARRCIRCHYRLAAERGLRILTEAYPAYAEAVARALADPDSRYFVNITVHGLGKPLAPSRVFPGLNETLDARLIREGHARDVPLCNAVAAVKPEEQREFYERYLKDPAEAQRWASLPRWQRPIMAGDPQDRLIWIFFDLQRSLMEAAGSEKALPIVTIANTLSHLGGHLEIITERRRLGAVLTIYAAMLSQGEDVGDPTRRPWVDERIANALKNRTTSA